MSIDFAALKNLKEAQGVFLAAKQKFLNADEDSLQKIDASEDMENILWWVLENYETNSDALLWVFYNSEDDSPVFDALTGKMDPKHLSFY